MDGGTWWATVRRLTEPDLTERLTLSLLERKFCFMSGALETKKLEECSGEERE